MSNYNTGNPVPSTDPRDLDDNATVFDNLVNGPLASYPDRRGINRKSWQQMEADAAALVAPNVAALAAVTPAIDNGVFFSATVPVTMGTYTLTTFARSLGAAAAAPAFRVLIGAMALTDTGAYQGSAARLTTARNIAVTGDATWSTSFDGSANVTATLTLENTGVSAGTYGSVTVNAKGLVTTASVATPIANGGTGATTQAAARTALGLDFSAWVNLTMQNSWIAQAGRRAAYRAFLSMVQLELQVSSGTATDGTVIATLPVGFRPPFPVVMPVAGSPNTALSTTVSVPRIFIATDGTIACFNCATGASIAFSGTFATV